MSFNKELQKFNIPYSLFKQLRKKIHVYYYVTQIWKGRKNTQTTLEQKKRHKNHAKKTRIFFWCKYVHGYHQLIV
jgi:hypothetical protein